MEKTLRSATSVATTMAVCLLLLLGTVGCKGQVGSSPGTRLFTYDSIKASNHIEPFHRLMGYVNNYEKLRSESKNDSVTFGLNQLAVSETFSRHALIALLSAPGTDSVRMYYGLKPNGEIAICIFPVDKQGNDIKSILVYPRTSTALVVPGVTNAMAGEVTKSPQGVEDSQRRPPLR